MAVTEISYADAMLAQLNPEAHANIIAVFERTCAAQSRQTAFSCGDYSLRFEELETYSRAFAAYLLSECGLARGDRIAIQLPNSLPYPIVAWGALRAGLILVNTNPLYTERELRHQFNDAGVKALVVQADLLASTAAVIPHTSVERLIVAQAGDFLADHPCDEYPEAVSLAQALGKGQRLTLPNFAATMDDVALLQYTGGTTGVAKGAVLSQGNLFASAAQASANIDLEDGKQEIIIAPMPLYHVYGFTWNVISSCLRGAHSVLIPNARDIDALIQAMKSHRFTGFAGVNTLFAALMRHPQFDQIDFSQLTGSIAGGAATVTSIAEEWQRRTQSQLFEGYALSETTSSLACNTETDNRLGTVGKPMPAMAVKTVNAAGETLGSGAEGELLVRGPQVLQGYWGRPEATAEALDADGWFRTGDIAVIEDDGFIRIVDRLKDMILVSGFNVYPNEIEDVVSGHPGIVECAVVGVKDERTAEAVKVFAVSSDPTLTADQLRTYCRRELTAYKVPKQVEFVAELPKSNVGKILRRELRSKN